MRSVSAASVIVLLVLNALALLPAAGALRPYLSGASLVIALLLLVAILATSGKKAEPDHAKVEPAKRTPTPAGRNQAEAEVISFIAMLQEKGRLIDFLMDDITPFGDAQVGAAARVVHEGCKAALQEHFRIRPVREENEGSTVKVPAGFAGDEYRLIGKIKGEAPFSGTLVHRGWKTDAVKLPRVLRTPADRLPTIAPAEVELK
jgi:uncharacterized protein (DUF58 family)